MLGILTALALLAGQPTTAPVTVAFDSTYNVDLVKFTIVSQQGPVPCLNVQVTANDTRCTAEIVRPNQVHLYVSWASCKDLADTTCSVRSEVLAVPAEGGGDPPGVFSVTFVGPLPNTPPPGETNARDISPATRISYVDHAALDYSTTMSLVVWAWFDNTTTFGELVRKDGNYILRQTGHEFHFIWWDGATLRGFLVPIPSLNAWHHIAVVVANNSPQQVYLDGKPLGLSVTFFGGGPRGFDSPLNLGGSAAGEPFDGRLAQLALYDSILTPENVSSLQRLKPSAVANATLRAYFPLDADLNEVINGLIGVENAQGGSISVVAGPPLNVK